MRELSAGLLVAPGVRVGLRPLLGLRLNNRALLFNQAVERADLILEFGERPPPLRAVSINRGEERVGRGAPDVVG